MSNILTFGKTQGYGGWSWRGQWTLGHFFPIIDWLCSSNPRFRWAFSILPFVSIFISLIKLKGSGSLISFFDLFQVILIVSRIRSIVLNFCSIRPISMFLWCNLWVLVQFSNSLFVCANSGFAASSLQVFSCEDWDLLYLNFLGSQTDAQGFSFYPLKILPSSQVFSFWDYRL